MMPSGKRVDDPPRKGRGSALRFRLTLAVRKNPIQVAMVVALVVLLVPVYMLIASNAQLRNSNRSLVASNSRLKDTLELSSINRAASSRIYCDVINQNADTNNQQTDYFQSLIISGAKQSRIFDDLYRQFGAPPYKNRLNQAKKTAGRLEQFRVDVLDCQTFVTRIQCEAEALATGASVEVCIRNHTIEQRPG